MRFLSDLMRLLADSRANFHIERILWKRHEMTHQHRGFREAPGDNLIFIFLSVVVAENTKNEQPYYGSCQKSGEMPGIAVNIVVYPVHNI